MQLWNGVHKHRSTYNIRLNVYDSPLIDANVWSHSVPRRETKRAKQRQNVGVSLVRRATKEAKWARELRERRNRILCYIYYHINSLIQWFYYKTTKRCAIEFRFRVLCIMSIACVRVSQIVRAKMMCHTHTHERSRPGYKWKIKWISNVTCYEYFIADLCLHSDTHIGIFGRLPSFRLPVDGSRFPILLHSIHSTLLNLKLKKWKFLLGGGNCTTGRGDI